MGNICVTPLASISVADYTTGDVVHLTGRATNLFGAAAQALQPRSNLLTLLEVTGFTYIKNGLPFRQKAGSDVHGSPYSPPVRLLAEEPGAVLFKSDTISLTVTRIALHSDTIATFYFKVEKPIAIIPGQSAVIDCSPFIGKNAYAHMAHQGLEASLNDDGIRTWTVSSAHPNKTTEFTITMREKSLGAVTSKLFNVARRVADVRPELLDDTTPLGLELQLVTIEGSFTLSDTAGRLLVLAGGIGITPFMSMISSMATMPDRTFDLVLVVSSREPGVIIGLLRDVFKPDVSPNLKLKVHIFSRGQQLGESDSLPAYMELHQSRLDATFLRTISDMSQREIMACGPPDWEKALSFSMSEVGIPAEKIRREGFAY